MPMRATDKNRYVLQVSLSSVKEDIVPHVIRLSPVECGWNVAMLEPPITGTQRRTAYKALTPRGGQWQQ
jgi:hypothetical protein